MKQLQYEEKQISVSSKLNNPDKLAAKLSGINPGGSYHVHDLIQRGMFTGDVIMDSRMVYVGRQCLGAQVMMHFLEMNNDSGRNSTPKNVGYSTLADYLNVTTTEMMKAVRQAKRDNSQVLQDGIVRLSHMRDLLPFIQSNGANRTTRVLTEDVANYLGLAKRAAYIIGGRLPHSIERADLEQDACIGLIDAAKRYDPSRGIKFETFVDQRIRGAMMDALREQNTHSRALKQKRSTELDAIYRLQQRLGRDPTEAEIAEAMGIPIKAYHMYRLKLNIAREIGGNGTRDIGDGKPRAYFFIHSSEIKSIAEASNPLDQLIAEEERKNLGKYVAQLQPREQWVIGLHYDKELNIKEIGKIIGMKESMTSHLHVRAIRKLRERMTDN